MSGLFAIDTALFRFVNQSLANPAFDWLMPVLAGGRWFVLLLVPVVLAWILWGGRRARLCALLLVLVVPLGDGLICNPLKHSIGRPRPYSELPETRLLVGHGANRSMPSGHAMNCFAAATVLFLFYRRSWRFSLPIAAAVAFSRVYNGVH